MGITILGNVNKIIEDNHGEMYFDNAQKIVNGETQTSASIPEAEVIEVVDEATDVVCTYNELFHPTEQNPQAVEALLRLAIERSATKKEVVKFLYAQRTHFNLHGKSSPKQSKLLNDFMQANNINKFNYPFSDDDFLRNYNS
jgi:hypothetical protein